MDIERSIADSFFIRRATAVAIATVTLLMLLAALSFWRQEEASTEAKGWLVHTYEVIGHIELLHGSLREAVFGQQGYLLTGDKEYIEPYEDALRDSRLSNAAGSLQQRPTMGAGNAPLNNDPVLGPGVANTALQQHRSIKQELAYIRNLTSDNPVQQSNLDEMDGVTQKLLDYLSAAIQERQNQDAMAAGIRPDIHRGKELMDHANSMVRIMESEESHLLALRTEADEINT
jgi:CHASE3 domain sensor protein